MKLSPREIEKIMVYSLASVAQIRKEKGIKLNFDLCNNFFYSKTIGEKNGQKIKTK